jgi:dipeptidyl aminopeptidase/acylaminoacyl peptidase
VARGCEAQVGAERVDETRGQFADNPWLIGNQDRTIEAYGARMRTPALIGMCSLAMIAGVGGAAASAAKTVGPAKSGTSNATSYTLYSVDESGRSRRTLAVMPPALFGSDGAGRVIGRSRSGQRVLIATTGGTVAADVDGSNGVTLTPPGQQVSTAGAIASFSRDGRQVAFSANDCSSSAGFGFNCLQLYVAASDGSDTRLLAANATLPTWSADGKWIAYYGGLGVNVVPAAVYVVHPDGSGLHRIAGDGFADSISFAPVGDRLAYTCTTEHGAGVCVIHADGSGKRLIDRGGATSLLWSPDGREIAVSQGARGVNHSLLATVTVATRRTRLLTNSKINGDTDLPLAWSPDSSRIAFHRTCVYGPPECRIAVYALTLRNGSKRRLSYDDRDWAVVHWVNHQLSYLAPTA